jgi:hypothetical protein
MTRSKKMCFAKRVGGRDSLIVNTDYEYSNYVINIPDFMLFVFFFKWMDAEVNKLGSSDG